DVAAVAGRAGIEQAFAAYFKEHPKARGEGLVRSIRFPAPDLAGEEGILRQAAAEEERQATTLYNGMHVSTGGRWQAAERREADGWRPAVEGGEPGRIV